MQTNKSQEKIGVAILGSTGSIGTQALDVIAQNPTLFQVEVLTAGSNVELLAQQALLFKPNAVVIADDSKYLALKNLLAGTDVKVFAGQPAVAQVCEMEGIDVVLTALVGFAGLLPTIAAIKAKKTIALANKETMVVAGAHITKLAKEHNVNIFPVDSEHSAIFQCLVGEWQNPIEKLILTASGGPFRGFSAAQLQEVNLAQALKHPNWTMGRKITIDSATLMNKGLEVIEAKWLFGVGIDDIEVVVHPQSIIHSMVQFADGSVKAQLGVPDMKLPIIYALAYPHRVPNQWPRADFAKLATLTFQEPDLQVFKCLGLAYQAMRSGGNMPTVLNAANEVAVASFLADQISFVQIPDLIERAMGKTTFIAHPSIDDLLATDAEVRKTALL